MAEGFRDAASAENTANSADVSVVVPATVQTNDGLILIWDAAGTGSTVPTPPAGYTQVAGPIDKGTVLRVYVFAKVASGADAGATVTVTKSAADATKKDLTVVAYSGIDTTNFISTLISTFASAVESTAGTTHNVPSVTVSGTTNWIGEFVVDRGSPSSSSFTVPSGFTSREQLAGSGSGTCSTAWADSGAPVASGTHSGDSFTGTTSTANAITLAMVIPAAGGTSATATPSRVNATASIGTPTVLNGSNVTVHPARVEARAIFIPMVGQVSSTMFPDTVAGTTTIPSLTPEAQAAALVVPELTVLYAVSIGTPTILIDGSPPPPPPDNPPASTTRVFVGPTRTETWALPDGRLAVKVTINQTLYRKNGVWLIGENLNWPDLEGVDRLYQGGATPPLTDAQLDELVAAGLGQYVVSTDIAVVEPPSNPGDLFTQNFSETF